MRFSTSPLLSAVMLCAASQSAVGAMALMDLDSRQILQLEGNLLFITEPLAEQLNGFPGMADKPVKGERQKFCVHGIIGARQTGASNEHEHQTQFS